MTRPPASGYDPPETGVIDGMSGTRRRIATAVTGLVTAAAVLSGCGTATIAGTAQPAAGAADLTTSTSTPVQLPLSFEQRVNDMVSDVVSFWSPMTGETYDDLTITIDARPDPDCPVDEWAAVCSFPDATEPELHIDRASLEPITRATDPAGDMTLAVFMAHEVGHVVTNKAVGRLVERMVSEQRAECAAGVFIRNRGENYGTTDDLKVAYKNRLKVFDVDDNKARDAMTAAFDVGVDSLTVEDCIAAYPE